jgi:hypothetical protein
VINRRYATLRIRVWGSGRTIIDALLGFVTHHTEGLGAIGFTLAVLAAAPFCLFRPPGSQRS